MDTPLIKAVIFDLGNVLINFDHTIAAKRIAALCDKSPQEIYQLFFDSNSTQLFEEGKICASDFFFSVKEMLGLLIGYEEFLSIWNGIFFLTDDNRKVHRLVKALRPAYTTALLSNINELHFQYLKKSFPVFDVFDHLFASYEMGFIKPDPRIYKKTLSLLALTPQETFYVDDRPELIAKACELGMRAFVYTGPEQLRKDLLACGVEIK